MALIEIIKAIEHEKASEHKFHTDNAPGIRHCFISNELFNEPKMYLSVRLITKPKKIMYRKKEYPQYVEQHTHECDSYWILLGENKDGSGLVGVIHYIENKEEKMEEIQSPAAIKIPKGVVHCQQVLRGYGQSITLLKGVGEYNESFKL